ncbi:glycosyltransferase [Virgibacillus sp. FSP13]
MAKRTPVFVFSSLNIVRGGLAKAVLKRANTLINHFDEVIFLTLKFQPNFHEIKEKLYKSGKLDKRVKVVNFFSDLMGPYKKGGIFKQHTINQVKEKGYVVFEDTRNALPSYRYYQNGLYKKYKRFDDDKKLLFIDYMNESRHRYQRDEYNKYGYLVRSRQMDLVHNKPKLDRYFDSKGECILSVWVDTKGNEKRTVYFKNKPQEYKTLYELYTLWVEDKVSKLKNPVIMSDSRYTDTLVRNINSKSVKKVAILHNNHYEEPYDETAEVKKSWKPFYDHIDSFDSVVFLTKEQKMDITNLFGEQSKYFVIPHAANPVKSGSSTAYDPNLAVTLARYHSQKRLDEAIKAFSYVIKEIPDAEYHIYGFGSLEDELTKQIRKLNLEENVKLKGFAYEPVKIYQKAACSILTSDYEGFGMVLTESLAAGTPVISYDVKYGPKDIIRDGIDGFLVPKGNTKKLASKTIEIMKNKELRDQLASNSKDVLDRFSEESFVNDWITVIDS